MTRFWIVQAVSISRLLLSLLFVSLAFGRTPTLLVACLYAIAILTDVIDGFAARRLRVQSVFGNIMDLVADKCLTAASLLYAASRGIDVLPLALIAIRDIVMIGMRLMAVTEAPLLPTNRIFGGVMALAVWANTLCLIISNQGGSPMQLISIVYWVCAVIFTLNLAWRVGVSRDRIMAAARRMT